VDAVVHLAAIPAPGQAADATVFHTNMSSTYNVFKAAATVGIPKVVWASSETLLGLPFATPPDYLPVDEDAPPRPETSYALSKLAGEVIAAEFCRWHPRLSIVALRFSNVMRPGDYADFVTFQEDPRLRAWNAWGYIDARDGAQAVRLALGYDRPGYEMFIIANADTVMMTPSAELAAQVFPDVPVTHELTAHETLLSIDKAKRLLGYEPQHSWRDELP
jgi:nucleoside-diphosphate-sugar epimerase